MKLGQGMGIHVHGALNQHRDRLYHGTLNHVVVWYAIVAGTHSMIGCQRAALLYFVDHFKTAQ